VGGIFSEDWLRLKRRSGRLVFANSELSGISILEEAQYHGIEAAKYVLPPVGDRNS